MHTVEFGSLRNTIYCMVMFLSQKQWCQSLSALVSRKCCLPQPDLTWPLTIFLPRKFINNLNCQIWICGLGFFLNEGNFCYQKYLLMEQILNWESRVRWISRSQSVFILILPNTTFFNLQITEVSGFDLCFCNIKITHGWRNGDCLGRRIWDYSLFGL